MNLTGKNFWDEYWGNTKIPSLPDKSHSFEPDLPIPITRFGNPIQIALKIFLVFMCKLCRFTFTDKFNHHISNSYI
jgi:hypothetical protein